MKQSQFSNKNISFGNDIERNRRPLSQINQQQVFNENVGHKRQLSNHSKKYETKSQQDNNVKVQEYQILLAQVKKLDAELRINQNTHQSLRDQISNLMQTNHKQQQLIQQLNSQTKLDDIKIKDLTAQLTARKNSSESTIQQLRNELTSVNIKNQKMVSIVKYMENRVQELEYLERTREATQSGLKKRIDQLTIQNQTIRKKMAKAEVQSEKYKLKALEAEQYWSGKISLAKSKAQQKLIQCKKQLVNKNSEQIFTLKAQNTRLDKLLKVRELSIKNLESKIDQLLSS